MTCGIFELRLVTRHLSLSLGQLHFVRARIDLGKHITLLYKLPLTKQYLRKLTIQACFRRDRLEGRYRPKRGKLHGDVARADSGGDYGDGSPRGFGSLSRTGLGPLLHLGLIQPVPAIC
jgi:hypothetical protein